MKNLYTQRLTGKRANKKYRIFKKGYLPGWTEEVSVVGRVVTGVVPTYKINEWDGTPVEGTFYNEDLQKVTVKDDDLFRVEKIVKRKGDSLGALEKLARQLRELDQETCLDIMKEFYVQLMSNASKTEFPTNAANSFKNRLPYPLQFKEPGWKVGLTNMSYPTPPTRPHQTHTFEPDDLICRFQWMKEGKTVDVSGKEVTAHFRERLILKGQDLIDDQYKITGGKLLMEYIVYRFYRQLTLV